MFPDYFELLGVSCDATPDQIRVAYRKLAHQYHPDKNPDNDTTAQMQQINEAYLILNDEEARLRYKSEYQHYRKSRESLNPEATPHEPDYSPHDDILIKWMNNARYQAKELSHTLIDEVAGAGLAAIKSVAFSLTTHLLLGGVLLITILAVRSCL